MHALLQAASRPYMHTIADQVAGFPTMSSTCLHVDAVYASSSRVMDHVSATCWQRCTSMQTELYAYACGVSWGNTCGVQTV